jgi:hypothetical protein
MKNLIRSLVVMACLTIASSSFAADEAAWKRVQRLDPGAKLTVTVEGAPPAERYFVLLKESELVVLNLTGTDLPKRQLLNMAKDNPDWMAATAKTIYKDNSVRVGPDGVFVKDKKVASLDEVVQHIPRAKVTAVDK